MGTEEQGNAPIEGQGTEETTVTTEKEQGGDDRLATIEKQIADMAKLNESLKKELSTRDKKITELQKTQMTEAERIEAERKEMQEKNVAKYLELNMRDLGIDAEFESLLGKDFDSIETNTALLKSFAEKATASKDAKIAELEKQLAEYKAGTGDPGRGSVNTADIDSRIAAAKREGNLPLATKLYMEKVTTGG